MVLTPREAIILCILLLCVPIQLWMSQLGSANDYPSSTFIDSLLTLKWILHNAVSPCFWLLVIESYQMVTDFSRLYPDNLDPLGECPAAEVRFYKNPEGHYGSSHVPRMGRVGVKFKVGQVVQHEKKKFWGIIIGWDKIYKGLDYGLFKNTNHKPLLPHYAVLVDQNIRKQFSMMLYIPEDVIKLAEEPAQLKYLSGKETEDYFSGFDGAQYIMRPWLRALYPRD